MEFEHNQARDRLRDERLNTEGNRCVAGPFIEEHLQGLQAKMACSNPRSNNRHANRHKEYVAENIDDDVSAETITLFDELAGEPFCWLTCDENERNHGNPNKGDDFKRVGSDA